MSGKWIAAVAAGVALLSGADEGLAELITFKFGGVVTSVQDPTGALDGGVRVNDKFSGTFTFDSATSDWMPGDPTYGGYDFTDAVMTLSVGSAGISSGSAARHSISVANDRYGTDGFTMGSFTYESGNLWVSELYIHLEDSTQAALGSDVLPSTPPDLMLFARREFYFQGQGAFDVRGTVTALTPEPQALVFLLLGILVVLRRR